MNLWNAEKSLRLQTKIMRDLLIIIYFVCENQDWSVKISGIIDPLHHRSFSSF